MEPLNIIREEQITRYFRARKKPVFPGAIYHLTQRASGKEPLFLEESDYLFMLHLLKEKAQKFNFEVFSFVLMSNHLHLQIKTHQPNLSVAMKNIFEKYANFFNQKYQRKGHVFCGPFRCGLCFDDAYLLATSLYIHLNPIKAGLIEDAAEYRWSSCGLYSRSSETKTFVNYQFILKILDDDIVVAHKAYNKLLTQGKEIETEEILENRSALDLFRAKLIKLLPKKIVSVPRESLSNEELDNKITELRNKRHLRSPQDLNARKFLIEQLLARGYTVQEIAKELSLSRQSIYATLNLTKQV